MPRIDQIRAMLEKSPDDVFLNFSLGMELQAAGLVDEAIAQFERTLTLDPNYVTAHVRKAQVLIGQKRLAEARVALQQGSDAAQAAGNRHMVDNIRQMLAQIPE